MTLKEQLAAIKAKSNPPATVKATMLKTRADLAASGLVITSYSIHYTKLYESCSSCGLRAVTSTSASVRPRRVEKASPAP